jgi:hypothetical protein
VRYSPRGWRGAQGLWFDLIDGGLGGSARTGTPSLTGLDELDDVLYVPPPGPGEEALRDELVAAAVERGLRPVVHTDLGDGVAAIPGPALLLVDELPRLVGSVSGVAEHSHLTQIGFGVEVVWLVPAIAGLTATEGRERRVCQRLEALGVTAVHVYEPRLEGVELRRVAEAVGCAGDEAVFHAEPADATALMRAAHRAGLRVLHPRPLVGVSDRARERRELAGLLGQAADLWLRAGRSPARGQALFRAAREVDRTGFDLRALAREGNLKVLAWLEEPAASVVAAWLAGGGVPLLDELVVEVLGYR